MARLPIEKENIDFIRLDLTRHYVQIDCDFTCYIVLNPSGIVPLEGTDICVLRIGAWQIDAWGFLTDKFTKNIPGFSACLCWDKTLETETAFAPRVSESDIDTANSVSSLKGQPVNITGFSLADGDSLPVKSYDDVWVNVRPFQILTDKNIRPFPVSSVCVSLTPNKAFSVDDVPIDWVVYTDDEEIHLKPRNIFASVDSNLLHYISVDCKGNYKAGYIDSQNLPTVREGLVDYSNTYVKLVLNNGIINSLSLCCGVKTYKGSFAASVSTDVKNYVGQESALDYILKSVVLSS